MKCFNAAEIYKEVILSNGAIRIKETILIIDSHCITAKLRLSKAYTSLQQ